MPLVEGDRAYFLHQRPYRDNSAMVHLFTQQHGHVNFIISGLKSKKQSKSAFLQPCRELLVSYQLKSGLCKMLDIDFAPSNLAVPGIDAFMFHQYVHELLLSLLPQQLPVRSVYQDYQIFLQKLAQQQPNSALRHIELALIVAFGGLPDVARLQDSDQAIGADKHYWFYPDRGLFNQRQSPVRGERSLDKQQIKAFEYVAHAYLQHDELNNETVAHGAKPVTTALIDGLLNGKSLKTRAVFAALQQYI